VVTLTVNGDKIVQPLYKIKINTGTNKMIIFCPLKLQLMKHYVPTLTLYNYTKQKQNKTKQKRKQKTQNTSLFKLYCLEQISQFHLKMIEKLQCMPRV
jgi:hypothetical protein